MLEITEIFNSLQGEGPFMGRPATFVRLSGCIKPYCPWCDTPYAREKGRDMDMESLLDQISAFENDLVVITGGEPFRQWNSGLETLQKRLIKKGCRIQYETSGKAGIPETVQGHVVCSPKFLEGCWHCDPEAMGRVDDFKFVVADDVEVVEAFIQAHAIPAGKIWIMPLGATRSAQLRRLAKLWQFCTDRKYNLAPRLHTLAFDNERGK